MPGEQSMRERRVLFVGQMGFGQTSAMRCAALERLGYVVTSVDSGHLWDDVTYLRRQIEQWRERGPCIDRFNDRVAQAIASVQPHLVWAEKQEYLDPTLLQHAKAEGSILAHYNPDPYFSVSWKRTRRADACLPLYDALVVTKRYELERYGQASSGQIFYTPLGFDPIWHQPSPPRPPSIDVAFIGGWEPRREELLANARAMPSDVSVWGYGWRAAQGSRLNLMRALRLGRITPGQHLYLGAPRRALAEAIRPSDNGSGEIYGATYADAIADSRIVLGLLREVCPDEHTTRTFEIPAMQGFMLADRSDEHREFFEEGREAVFFGDDDEFVDRLAWHLAHDSERRRIAEAGRRRCLTSGYSYDERLRPVLHAILPLKYT